MAYIDPSGLFDGDRFDLCGDEARLFWPHYWAGSNGHGRIELNYRKIAGTIFKRWSKAPDENTFWTHIRAYRQSWLLFVYEVNGVVWGQWWTSEKFLPKYKTSADSATPKPEDKDFSEWRDEYISHKRAKCNPFNNCGNVLELSETFRTSRYDKGVAVGVAVDNDNGVDNQPPKPPAPKPGAVAVMLPLRQWFDEFYALYWRKRHPDKAFAAFCKRVKSETDWITIRAAVMSQTPEMISREPAKRPYPATWLNAGAMFDEVEAVARGGGTKDKYQERRGGVLFGMDLVNGIGDPSNAKNDEQRS